MFGGGGGLNPRKMKQMMEQMGIEITDIDAEEIVIRTPDEELVFSSAEVQRMDAQGQATYQIVGEPETRPRGESGGEATTSGTTAGGEETTDASASGSEIPDEDVEIVAQQAGVNTTEAREALEAEDGDLAAAISRLE